MAIGRLSEGGGVAFLVSAGIVYEIIAAACSSPQTAEINASTRAPTLMKWVHVGLVQSALFVAAAAWFDPRHRTAYIAGGVAAGIIMYGSYVHAVRSGLASDAAGTEDGGAARAGLSWGNPT